MAKREIVAEGNKEALAPAPSKAATRKFQQLMAGMVASMAKRFENQTFKKLNKGTIDKFEDCTSIVHNGRKFEFKDVQIGNYASIFLTLSKKAKRSILKQFSDKRIQQIVRQHLNQVNNRNQKQLYGKIESITGISSKELVASEGLKASTNALMLETEQWAKKLRDDSLESFVNNSLRGMALGKSLDEVIEDFGLLKGKKEANANMIARTQLSTFNSLLTKNRAQNLGITKAKWRTAEDERVRPCHQVRNGKEFDLNKGLHSSCDGKTLLPGVDYNCRCDYELIIPEV